MVKRIATKKYGFTLSEILITLGIIGIIAALTLPALLNAQQQQTTIQKLKKSFANMSNAVAMSEASNSHATSWVMPSAGNAAETLNWFNTYIEPYLKYDSVSTTGNSVLVKLQDGVDLEFVMESQMVIIAYLNGRGNTQIVGRNVFYYEIKQGTDSDAFRPYEEGATGSGRAKWRSGAYACTYATTMANRRYCTGLLITDSWDIANDYPW